MPRRTRLLALALLAAGVTGATSASVAPDVTGTWIFRVVTPNGTGTPTVTLKQEGDKITGTYESNALGSRTLTGRVYGDSLAFDLSVSAGGEGVVLTYAAAIVTADSLNGHVDFAGQGGADFTAVRQR